MTAQPCDPPEYEPPDLGSVDALDYDLAEIRHAITRLSDDVPAALDADDTLETLVPLLAELREREQALGQVRAYVEAAVATRMPRRTGRVGGFEVKVHGGSEWRDWNDSRVAWAICQDLIVDINGEVVPELAQALSLVRDRFLKCGAVKWRTTELKPLGVEPANYAKRADKRKTVQLAPVVDEATP